MYKTARIYFYKCVINAQTIGTEADFLYADVYFSVTAIDPSAPSGKNLFGFDSTCVAKQPHGETYFDNPIEVELPKNFPIRVPFLEFSDAVEQFLRLAVNNHSAGITIVDSSNVQIRNYTHRTPMTVSLDLPRSGGGW